jgi:dGTPase
MCCAHAGDCFSLQYIRESCALSTALMTKSPINDRKHPAYGQDLAPGQRLPAAYAASAVASLGRVHAERECTTRSPFQRDRDRILHSTAFRRLTHKTQVFLFHEGDHFRTRLTHSLEVAQIARTIARQLRLDEDLAEALALAHDLGHSPFGHAGERALDGCVKEFGGFDHNAQSLRVVMDLERKYLSFDGLNLTWETLEGLAKHNGPIGTASEHPVVKVTRRIEAWKSLRPHDWASGEAQVASLSDDIAYLNHDIDDGLRAGLIDLDDLKHVALAGPCVTAAVAKAAAASDARIVYEVTRQLITGMIRDVVDESRARLDALSPESPEDIRSAGRATVAFSKEMAAGIASLRAFLFERVYRHEKVSRVMAGAEQVVTDLFARYRDVHDPEALPTAWVEIMRDLDARGQARLAADYLAGQTDRYALDEHRRLFKATPELR